jgi:hypothetical protein
MSVLATGRIKPTSSASEASYKRTIYVFIVFVCNTVQFSGSYTVSPMSVSCIPRSIFLNGSFRLNNICVHRLILQYRAIQWLIYSVTRVFCPQCGCLLYNAIKTARFHVVGIWVGYRGVARDVSPWNCRRAKRAIREYPQK